MERLYEKFVLYIYIQKKTIKLHKKPYTIYKTSLQFTQIENFNNIISI